MFVELLLNLNPPLNDVARKALTVAITVAYCRPFKQRRQVKLSEDVVPTHFKDIHDNLVVHRDKAVAHHDLDGPVADWGFISQLQINIMSGQMTHDTLSPVLPNETAHDMIPLLIFLIEKMDESINAFQQSYLSRLPPTDASYVVSLDDNPTEWLITN